MSVAKNQGGNVEQRGDAEGGRVWSTAYIAVAFGLGLALGFVLGGVYGSYWAGRHEAAGDMPMEHRGGAVHEVHDGHEAGEHDHEGHAHP